MKNITRSLIEFIRNASGWCYLVAVAFYRNGISIYWEVSIAHRHTQYRKQIDPWWSEIKIRFAVRSYEPSLNTL